MGAIESDKECLCNPKTMALAAADGGGGGGGRGAIEE